MLPFHILADIQHDAGEEVEYQWETHRQEGRVNKKQSDFGDRDIKAFAQVGANTERVPLEKCYYPLQHITPF